MRVDLCVCARMGHSVTLRRSMLGLLPGAIGHVLRNVRRRHRHGDDGAPIAIVPLFKRR